MPPLIYLSIPRAIYDQMLAHCHREAPVEACGLLAGAGTRVTTIYPLRNDSTASQTRYDASPVDLIAAHIDIRETRRELLAIYHSHPRWPAVPSKTDLDLNYYEGLPRIIVSLLTNPPDTRVWRFSKESYTELGWEVI